MSTKNPCGFIINGQCVLLKYVDLNIVCGSRGNAVLKLEAAIDAEQAITLFDALRGNAEFEWNEELERAKSLKEEP